MPNGFAVVIVSLQAMCISRRFGGVSPRFQKPAAWIALVLAASSAAFSRAVADDAGKTIARDSRYPAAWWNPIPKDQAKSWEILPQEAELGEVILSKRNELGL